MFFTFPLGICILVGVPLCLWAMTWETASNQPKVNPYYAPPPPPLRPSRSVRWAIPLTLLASGAVLACYAHAYGTDPEMPTANLISLAVFAVFFVVQIACDICRVEERTSLDEEPKTLANRAERNERPYEPVRQTGLEQIVAAIHRADAPPPLRAIASERW